MVKISCPFCSEKIESQQSGSRSAVTMRVRERKDQRSRAKEPYSTPTGSEAEVTDKPTLSRVGS